MVWFKLTSFWNTVLASDVLQASCHAHWSIHLWIWTSGCCQVGEANWPTKSSQLPTLDLDAPVLQIYSVCYFQTCHRAQNNTSAEQLDFPVLQRKWLRCFQKQPCLVPVHNSLVPRVSPNPRRRTAFTNLCELTIASRLVVRILQERERTYL